MKLTLTVASQNLGTIRAALCQAYIAVGEYGASNETKKTTKKLKCCSEKCGTMEWEP